MTDTATMTSWYDTNANLALWMGPLYHLLEEWERQRVIQLCAHVVRPGGYT
jgi:hypothetical protein